MFTWADFGNICAILGCGIGLYDLLVWVYFSLPKKMLKKHQEKVELQRSGFGRISIPLVRRIYPRLIAENIVSVQPMTQPASLMYLLRWQHARNQGTVNEGPPRAGMSGVAAVLYGQKPRKKEKVNWLKEGF